MVTILDGGGGSKLADVAPHLRWNPIASLLEPLHIRACHKAFADCGCQVLQTLTYTTTPRLIRELIKLSSAPRPVRDALIDCVGGDTWSNNDVHGVLDNVSKLVADVAKEIGKESKDDIVQELLERNVKQAIRLARETKTESMRVALCVPPYGDSYDASDEWPQEEERFYGHLSRLADSETVDLVMIETMPSLRLAAVALRAFSSSKVPVWVSFVPISGKCGPYLLDGTPVATIPDWNAWNPGRIPDLVLFNCGSLAATDEAIDKVHARLGKVGAYPNNEATDTDVQHEPYRWEDIVQDWFEPEDSEADDTSTTDGGEEAGHEESSDDGEPSFSSGASSQPYSKELGDTMERMNTLIKKWIRKKNLVAIGGCCGVDEDQMASVCVTVDKCGNASETADNAVKATKRRRKCCHKREVRAKSGEGACQASAG